MPKTQSNSKKKCRSLLWYVLIIQHLLDIWKRLPVNLSQEKYHHGKIFFFRNIDFKWFLWFKEAGVPIFVEHWGGNLQFYPIFNVGGDKPRPRFCPPNVEHVFLPNSGKNQKNGLFSPNLSGHLCSDAHQSRGVFRGGALGHGPPPL